MGRNKSLVRESVINEHFQLSPELDRQLRLEAKKLGISIRRLIELKIIYTSPEEREKSQLEKKKAELELALAQVNFKLENIKRLEREKSEFEKKVMHDRKYCVESFRLLYDVSKRTPEKKILTDPSILAGAYGISLNIRKCNENFDIVQELPDDELIKFLDIKKVPGHAKREEEILRKIGGV